MGLWKWEVLRVSQALRLLDEDHALAHYRSNGEQPPSPPINTQARVGPTSNLNTGSGCVSTARLVCLLFLCFVCLFHGAPVVRGGHRLTKDGPYATRRQAEAVLFVRRRPTPPFAGC